MKPVEVVAPPGAVVINQLYPSLAPQHLGEDLLTIELSNGFVVDVGWYPEHDPQGEFVVHVFYEFFDNLQTEPYKTRDPHRAAYVAQELAHRYASAQFSAAGKAQTTRLNPVTV